MTEIQRILQNLGITRCYKGYDYAVYAVWLAMENDMRLTAVTKGIYMEVADFFGCNRASVERNLRTVSARAWQANPAFLCHIAGYPLNGAPAVSEFIEIISSYLLRGGQGTWPLRQGEAFWNTVKENERYK